MQGCQQARCAGIRKRMRAPVPMARQTRNGERRDDSRRPQHDERGDVRREPPPSGNTNINNASPADSCGHRELVCCLGPKMHCLVDKAQGDGTRAREGCLPKSIAAQWRALTQAISAHLLLHAHGRYPHRLFTSPVTRRRGR